MIFASTESRTGGSAIGYSKRRLLSEEGIKIGTNVRKSSVSIFLLQLGWNTGYLGSHTEAIAY
jgi:hypothetical protein